MTLAERDIWRQTDPPAEPRRYRYTIEQWEDLIARGILEGQRVELIDGEIIEMPPMSEPHATCITLTHRVLYRMVEPDAYVRVQMPFLIRPGSMPEPDLAVVRGQPGDGGMARPEAAMLLVEACLSTASEDRGRKPFLYASAQVPEYWLIDLRARRLEIYRKPIADADQLFGHRYAEVSLHEATATVSLLAKPGVTIAVSDLLPKLDA